MYTGLIVATLWAGANIINYVADLRFYKRCMTPWETAAEACKVGDITWPSFTGNDLKKYMDRVSSMMKSSQLGVPESNTNIPYIYIEKRITGPEQKIFLVCLPDRLIIYGFSAKTINHHDKFIDQRLNLTRGFFQGKPDKENNTFTGIWKFHK